MTRHAAACLAAGWTASFPDRARSQATAGADIPDVAVVRGEPAKAVARAFDLLGGAGRFIGTGATVLLKPNVSFPNPERFGSTTSPAVVRAVAMLALNAGASRVIVADHTMQDSTRCFDRTGIREAVDGLDGARIIALDREVLFTETAVPGGKALSKVGIAKLIERSDVLINMPCAKSHTATQVSFGLKNLMGLIWDRTHFHTETDLDTAIAELATVIRPQLTLLDATRALVTGGPTGPGKVQELNTVIAGVNPLAVDVYAMTIAPWNNRSVGAQAVRHLAAAADIGLGVIDAASLSVVQETV
ncbi:DUF362 domain-containing protein [bacterium]|nr:DUF362 domain-containing protein [bacterium]